MKSLADNQHPDKEETAITREFLTWNSLGPNSTKLVSMVTNYTIGITSKNLSG